MDSDNATGQRELSAAELAEQLRALETMLSRSLLMSDWNYIPAVQAAQSLAARLAQAEARYKALRGDAVNHVAIVIQWQDRGPSFVSDADVARSARRLNEWTIRLYPDGWWAGCMTVPTWVTRSATNLGRTPVDALATLYIALHDLNKEYPANVV